MSRHELRDRAARQLRRWARPQDTSPPPSTPVQPPFRELLRGALHGRLGHLDEPGVVVVSDRVDREVEDWVLEFSPRAQVHWIEVGADDGDDDVFVAVATQPRPDLLVDETRGGRQMRRARRLFYLLAPGGALLLRRPGKGAPGFEAERRALAEIASDAATGVADVEAGKSGARGDRGLFGRRVAETRFLGGSVLLARRRTGRSWLKVRDEWSTRLLAATGAADVRSVAPALELSSCGAVDTSPSDIRGPFVTSWSVPELFIRSYAGVTSAPGQVVTSGDLILPESYRHIAAKRLRHEVIEEIAPDFADPRTPAKYAAQPEGEPKLLEGSYFHLDNEFRGHFGHLLTESVSRLWAWPELKAEHPDLKLLLHMNTRELKPYEKTIYAAAGVDPADIVFTHEPVRVERLFGATPMFSNPYYVHPQIVDLWKHIGDGLAAGTRDMERPRRIFVARRIEKRPCRNAPDVEAFFTSLGFTVLYPEDHDLGEQVRLFREADVIAGYAGSGLFNAMFSAGPKSMVIVSSESYTGENEMLMGGVLGHDIRVAWCRSEGEWLGNRWAPGSYHQPFTFDFEREGEYVRKVVSELGN